MTEHPDDDALQALAAGSTPGLDSPVVAHVEDCSRCQQRLQALTEGGSLVEWMARSRPDPSAYAPVVPGFDLLEILGEGGMGVVYRAFQHHPARHVALKLVRPDVYTERALNRFEFEIEAMARLRHPHIAQLFGAGVIEGGGGRLQPYLVMELVSGRPLGDEQATAALDLRRRVRLLASVVGAIDHAHGRGVVHGDIKPDNILVDQEGSPRVIDLGLARIPGMQTAAAGSGSGDLHGSLGSMAPELIDGTEGETSVSSDVWALGVLGWELLCGEHPFAVPADPLATRRAILGAEPSAPGRGFRLGGGGATALERRELEAILRRALARDPADRMPSAAALGDELDAFLTGRPVAALGRGWSYRARKRHHRQPRVAVAGLVVAVLVGALMQHQWRTADEQARLDAAIDKADRAATEKAAQILDEVLFDGLAADEQVSVRLARVERATRALWVGARRMLDLRWLCDHQAELDADQVEALAELIRVTLTQNPGFAEALVRMGAELGTSLVLPSVGPNLVDDELEALLVCPDQPERWARRPADVLERMGAYALAAGWHERVSALCVALLESDADAGLRGQARRWQAVLAWQSGDLDTALQRMSQVEALLDSAGVGPERRFAFHNGRGVMLRTRAARSGSRRDLEAARADFERALEWASEMDDDVASRAVLNNQGRLALLAGDLTKAQRKFAKALELAHWNIEAEALTGLAWVLFAEPDLDRSDPRVPQARRWLRAAVILRSLQRPWTDPYVCEARSTLGEWESRFGDPGTAAELLQTSLDALVTRLGPESHWTRAAGRRLDEHRARTTASGPAPGTRELHGRLAPALPPWGR